jgi:chaperone required for assembly of F1-ATPase
LEDKNVENNADDGGLAVEISGRSLKTLLGKFVILI